MENNRVWSTELVNETRAKLERGEEVDKECFHPHDIDFKRANISFKYTEDEQMEIVRCANDILYFADKYAYAMTDNGIQKITLRPYQRKMLKYFQDNRFCVMCASRQIGKCHFLSKIYIRNEDGSFSETLLETLYYESVAKQRSLTFFERVVYALCKLYAKL